MNNGYFDYPMPVNEQVLSYAPGSAERKRLKEVLAELKKTEIDVPMYIGSKEVRTNKKLALHPPHEIGHTLGHFNAGEEKHVTQAIDAALAARESWASSSWENRAQHIFKGRRSACHQIPALYECDDDAWPEQECFPGRDRCGL